MSRKSYLLCSFPIRAVCYNAGTCLTALNATQNMPHAAPVNPCRTSIIATKNGRACRFFPHSVRRYHVTEDCEPPQCVEDEQHFLFDCLADAPLRVQSACAYLFQQGCTVADFLSKKDEKEPWSCGGFIRNCFFLWTEVLTD